MGEDVKVRVGFDIPLRVHRYLRRASIEMNEPQSHIVARLVEGFARGEIELPHTVREDKSPLSS